MHNIILKVQKIVDDWLSRLKKSSVKQGTFSVGKFLSPIKAMIRTWHFTATLANITVPATATGFLEAPVMMQSGNGDSGGVSEETSENKNQVERAKTEPQESSEVNPKIRQVYNSLKDSLQYPEDFRLVQNGTKKLSIKNKQLLEELRKIEPGEWNKSYKDGYS